MQKAGKILSPNRLSACFLQRFRSFHAWKVVPCYDQVSQNLHFRALGVDVSAKIQTVNVNTLEFSRNMHRGYLQRAFSSESSQNVVKHSGDKEKDSTVIVRVINNKEWCEETEKELGSLDLNLSSDTVLGVLQSLEKTPEIVLNFFMWAGRQTDFEHNASTYNSVLRVLGHKPYIQQFWNIIKEMKSEGYQIDVKTYIIVLRRFMKRKMMQEAVGLFTLMMDNEHKPSSQNCSTVLHHLSLSSDPDLGLVSKVVEVFRNGGGCLNKAIYDGIHRSLCSAGKFDEAEEIVKGMKEAGFMPDNVTYSQLVFGLCKVGRLDEARMFLDEMEGLGCIPDLKTWTILIEGHCQAREIDKAYSCFRKMLENGCVIDSEVLGVLVNGFCSQNRVVDAHNFLRQMIEEQKVKPWQATYKIMLQQLTRAGKLSEALELLELMKNQGFPPFADPFIEVISRTGTVDGAVQFLSKLTKKRAPSINTYSALLKAFCKADKQAEAQELLYKCPHHIRNNPEVLSLFGSMNAASPA